MIDIKAWFAGGTYNKGLTEDSRAKTIDASIINEVNASSSIAGKFSSGLSSVWNNIKKWYLTPQTIAVDTTVSGTEAGVKISENISKIQKNFIGSIVKPLIAPLILIGICGIIILTIMRKF